MESTNKTANLAWIALLTMSILLPLICGYDKYILHTAISICFNISLATSMWLVLSLGFVNFAHAGFMGIGAYASALLYKNFGMSLWLTMWIASGLAMVIGAIISIPLMRTRAVYFFMASWAVGEVIKRIFAYFRNFFGGWDGIFDILPPELHLFGLQIDFSNRVAYYYLVLFFCVVTVLMVYRLNESRTGMIYWSIHESEILAQHLGVNILKHKVVAFSMACFFAGLTGALYAHYHTYINPKTFDIWLSEFSLVHCIVGGMTTVAGPVMGAGILTIADELLRPTGYFRVIFFGIIVIFTVLFMPDGMEAVPEKLRLLFRNKDKE